LVNVHHGTTLFRAGNREGSSFDDQTFSLATRQKRDKLVFKQKKGGLQLRFIITVNQTFFTILLLGLK
jgi:hypothetical protein